LEEASTICHLDAVDNPDSDSDSDADDIPDAF
jgi:hypothetical protein